MLSHPLLISSALTFLLSAHLVGQANAIALSCLLLLLGLVAGDIETNS